jgi:hypothetical protein
MLKEKPSHPKLRGNEPVPRRTRHKSGHGILYQHDGNHEWLNSRAQNVPKTKVERVKLVEITEARENTSKTENFD